MSDSLNDSLSFIPLLNAEIHVSGELVAEHSFLGVNKQLIAYVSEE